MEIIVRKRNDNALIARLSAVLSCQLHEKLSTEKTIGFSSILDGGLERIHDGENYVLEYDSDFYDISKVKKSLSGGLYQISVDGEHVSYRLTRLTLTDFTVVGNPREILTELLAGSEFFVGEVEPTSECTFSINSETTVRAAILAFCQSLGCDAEFAGYYVHIRTHRGSNTIKKLVERNVVDIAKTTDMAENSRNYTCTLRSPTDVHLGDEVHFCFCKLDIDENVRVVGMKWNPFTSRDITLEVDHYVPTIESQFTRIETSMVAKGKNYYGVSISPENGLTISRADGTASVRMNANEFAMQAADSEGHMQNRIYFDPISGDYKFIGNVNINGGEINIGNNFRVDQNGNAYLAGDATIYGGKYYAGNPGQAEGFSQMTADGFVVYNAQTDVKLRFGYTSSGEDFPYVQLGSGSGVSTDYGLIKKFSDGLWIGNSDPADDSGEFQAKEGYNGLFFKFEDNTAYIVQGQNMRNIYTGAAIAKFG